METRASYVLTGAFVLGLIAAGVVFLLWVSGRGDGASGVAITVEFRQDVTGLNKGAVVRYRGIPVGAVRDIGLDPANPDLVLVGIDVQPDARIYPDFVAALEQQGLTGIPFIQLKRPPERRQDAQPVAAADMPEALRNRRIPGTPTNLQRLIEEVPRAVTAFRTLAERATETVARLDSAFGGPTGKGIDSIVRSLEKAAGDIAVFTAEARLFAGDARAVAKDLRPAVKELAGTIRAVRSLADKAEAVFSEDNRKRLTQILQNVETASADASRFIREAEQRARDLEPVLKELPTTLGNISTFSTSATRLSDRAAAMLDDENRQRVERILASAETAADDVRTVARETREATRKVRPAVEKLGESLSRMADTVAKIDEGAEAFTTMSRQIARLVEENRQPVSRFLNAGLYDVSQFVADGRRLVHDFNRLIRRIENDPPGFFFGQQGGLRPGGR